RMFVIGGRDCGGRKIGIGGVGSYGGSRDETFPSFVACLRDSSRRQRQGAGVDRVFGMRSDLRSRKEQAGGGAGGGVGVKGRTRGVSERSRLRAIGRCLESGPGGKVGGSEMTVDGLAGGTGFSL